MLSEHPAKQCQELVLEWMNYSMIGAKVEGVGMINQLLCISVYSLSRFQAMSPRILCASDSSLLNMWAYLLTEWFGTIRMDEEKSLLNRYHRWTAITRASSPRIGSSTARSGHDRWVAVPALTALLLASSTGCAVQPPQTSEVRVRHLPPTKGDVIEAAIKSHGVPLSVHYSCSTMVGTQRSTIGDYLAEQILSFSETASKWIDVDFVPIQTPSGYYWHATVMFHFLESNGDPFEYGVRFLIRQSDGGVVPTSFSCPGVP